MSEPTALERFLNALGAGGVELHVEDVLDVFWLATRGRRLALHEVKAPEVPPPVLPPPVPLTTRETPGGGPRDEHQPQKDGDPGQPGDAQRVRPGNNSVTTHPVILNGTRKPRPTGSIEIIPNVRS